DWNMVLLQGVSHVSFQCRAGPITGPYPPRPVRPSRRATVRRPALAPAPGRRPPGGGRVLAGSRLQSGADAVGVPHPTGQRRRVLPGGGGPCHGLAGGPRPAPVLAQHRPLLQGPPPTARVPTGAIDPRDRPRTPPAGAARMAVARPAGQGGRRDDRVD